MRYTRPEEVGRLRPDLPSELPKRREVIEDPEPPPVGGCDKIPFLHGEVVDRHRRKVELELLPAAAIVGRHPHPTLRSGVEQPARNGIGAYDPRELIRRDACVYPCPSAAIIRGLPQVR